MSLFYETLQRPRYIFSGERRYPSPFHGLRTAGPFALNECPTEPRILFVYPTELRESARKLYFSLKNGVGPFRGTGSLLKFQLQAKNIERLTEFSVAGLDDHSAALVYHENIEGYLAADHPEIHLALILHRRTSQDDLDNPYLTSKFPLLGANIPTQVVTSDLIDHESTFQWSAANIALAMFAKMGGIPWAVETGLEEDSVVVGINRTSVPLKSGGMTRFYGFATVFSHHGVFRGTKLFEPMDGWDAYLKGLEAAVTDALATWQASGSGRVNLVLHVRKEISRDETDIITRCLERLESEDSSYAFLRLVDADDMLVFSRGDQEAFNPPPGIMVRLAGHRAILQIAGYDPKDQTLGKRVTTRPWHVVQVAASNNAPDFSVLCRHILALSAMNWRGLNSEASPVSVQYPRLVANLLGRFEQAGFDVEALRGSPVMQRTWFI